MSIFNKTILCIATSFVAWMTLGWQAAAAQEDPEPASAGTVVEVSEIKLVTSEAEVRRAVIGLSAVAGVLTIATALYWVQTGRDARARFAYEHARRSQVRAKARARQAQRAAPRHQAPRHPVGRTPVPVMGERVEVPWWEREDFGIES